MTLALPAAASGTALVAVYCGVTLPDTWASAWTASPMVWSVMAAWTAATVAFARDTRAAWAALACAALLYLSPLCALAGTFFGARVVHHVLLACAVAPLLAQAIVNVVDRRRRRSAGLHAANGHRGRDPGADGPLTSTGERGSYARSGDARDACVQGGATPLVAAFACFAVVFWFWHVPAAYAFGLTDHIGYWLMQSSILAASVWFWWCVRSGAASVVSQVLALLGTAAHMGLLGALIVFAPTLLYPLHAPSVLAWGIDPMSDQQFGGLVMWVPGVTPFLAAGLWRIWASLREPTATALRPAARTRA